MFRRVIFNSVLIVLSCLVSAQSYRFKHITSEEGLPTNYISDIIQDNKGFMWFGTQAGLSKYDGYNFTVYKFDPATKNSLSSSDITSIYQHENNLIYIGTRNAGIAVYDPFKNSFERIPTGGSFAISDPKVNCIKRAGKTSLWIGTGNGFSLFNTVDKKALSYKFPCTDAVEVNCFYELNGTLLIGTANEGLWKLVDNKTIEKISLINADKQTDDSDLETINGIAAYKNVLYLGTYGSGVVKVNTSDYRVEKNYKVRNENENINFIEDLRIDNGLCYAITRFGFIVIDLDKDEAEVLLKSESDKKSLNDNYLTSIFIDDQKNIWLGTFAGGVNVAFSQTQKFPNLPKKISEQFRQTFSFFETAEGDLWIGGEHSLKRFKRNSSEVEDFSKVIENNHALAITGDKHGNLWIGTWGLGLIKFDPKTGKKENFLSQQTGNTVLALRFDKDERLWIGTYGDGLFIYDLAGKKMTQYTQSDGLSNNNLTSIFADSKNNIWLGTDGGGVCCVKDGLIEDKNAITKFEHSDNRNSISSNSVYSILENNGVFWFATSNGVSKYNVANKTFSTYIEKDGLGNNFVYSLLTDNSGKIWMSTNSGISRFDPNMENELGSAFKNYDQKDGLLNVEYVQGAYLKTSKGELVFGGPNGINIFDPSQIKDNRHTPPVYIVSYKRSGKKIETDTAISGKRFLKLGWRENYFQFELAALDFNAPSKNKYMYMLEGYDNEWSAPSNVRFVSYTELPGGDYVFKVKAANNDGVWNELPYQVYITVVPPFWKTGWFYITVSVFGIAVIVLFTQYRTKAIKKENKVLEQKVAERTKELAEKNRDITGSIEYAKRIQEALLPSTDHIYSSFKHSFILYQPKDIVSGDFYWFGVKNERKILAVVDCTGHGVPGAFMSMIGHNLLNQIVQEKNITDPAQILNELHKGVQYALKQGTNEHVNTNDGMDVSLISVDEGTGKLFWAGAYRPMVIVNEKGALQKIDGNKYPVGGAQLDVSRKFTTHEIDIKKESTIYMFSDGYADQFGGEKGKKFMVRRFHDLLSSFHAHSIAQQKKELETTLKQWRGNHEQVDDILVIGIRF